MGGVDQAQVILSQLNAANKVNSEFSPYSQYSLKYCHIPNLTHLRKLAWKWQKRCFRAENILSQPNAASKVNSELK